MKLSRRELLVGLSCLSASKLLARGNQIPGSRRATVEHDVCIIGSGFAGIYLGLKLAEGGLRTLILEAGAFPVAGSRPEGNAELFPVETEGEFRFPVDETRAIAVGGASSRWSGVCARFLPTDLRSRSEFGLFTDWPIRYSDLESYYCEAERALEVRGTVYRQGAEPPRNCAYPREIRAYTPPAGPLVEHRPLFVPVPFSTRGKGASAIRLVDREIPRFQSLPGAELRERSAAIRLHATADGLVESIEVAGPEGGLESIRARQFIVAAGPIESARLLLASRSRADPNGLGNRAGLLGANFNAHPRYRTRFTPGPDSRYPTGIHRTYSLADEFRRSGAGSVHLDLHIRESGCLLDLMRECEPDPANRLTLDGRTRDPFGRPSVRLRVNPTPIDVETATRSEAVRRAALEQLTAGGGRSEAVDLHWFHPAGTCRMGASEATGVVDSNCRVFGLENLFVLGASVFPTSGCVNPTLTIVALAFRLADHIVGTTRW